VIILNLRTSLNYLMIWAFIIVIVIYALYHSLNGERGLFAFLRLKKQIEISQAQLEAIHSQRLKYERNVKLLRNESIDLDLLDEQARRLLGYADKDEKIYNLDEAKE